MMKFHMFMLCLQRHYAVATASPSNALAHFEEYLRKFTLWAESRPPKGFGKFFDDGDKDAKKDEGKGSSSGELFWVHSQEEGLTEAG